MRYPRIEVTKQDLYCIENNGIFPQDIQKTQNMYLTFGSVGLTATMLTPRAAMTKHINGYRSMTADEINEKFGSMEWEKEN